MIKQTLVRKIIYKDTDKKLLKQSLIARQLFNKAYVYIDKHNCSYSKLYSVFRNDSLYRSLKAQVAQQVLRLVEQNYKSYKKLMIEYYKNSNKLTGKPEKYKPTKRPLVLNYTNQCSSIKDGHINLSKNHKIPFNLDKNEMVKNYQQIRIVKLRGKVNFKIEIIYHNVIEENEANNSTKNHYMGIDPGVKNYVTISCSNGNSYIHKGDKCLSIINDYHFLTNQNTIITKGDKKYKIKKTKYKHASKRYRRMDDLNHKLSRKIIDIAIENKVKRIVMGSNVDWKSQSNLGKDNNRKFQGIAYSDLIRKISYKAEAANILISYQEESYTSKCDFLSNEEIRRHKKYSGNRVNRNTFVSGTGKILNADVNAAFNIIKKYIDSVVTHEKNIYEELIQKGHVYCPNVLSVN